MILRKKNRGASRARQSRRSRPAAPLLWHQASARARVHGPRAPRTGFRSGQVGRWARVGDERAVRQHADQARRPPMSAAPAILFIPPMPPPTMLFTSCFTGGAGGGLDCASSVSMFSWKNCRTMCSASGRLNRNRTGSARAACAYLDQEFRRLLWVALLRRVVHIRDPESSHVAVRPKCTLVSSPPPNNKVASFLYRPLEIVQEACENGNRQSGEW